jgi:hypothetical protein
MVSIDKVTHAPVEVAKLEHTPDLVVAKQTPTQPLRGNEKNAMFHTSTII